ncbi:DUF418 domain-containing protein [Serinicoccus kebangsaanensis]|uniref:DUF418 domain-containing protein n=1 Tax=Serinicoccus kebangsaanensis TaxID=2602069 RepID=UPI00124EE22F|nr:DUF418 domain-containing protein [Serinicoccus kebangsaanensis]
MDESGPGAVPRSASGARLDGVDMARAAAVAGMVAVHLRPQQDEDGRSGVGDLILNLPYGRASVLFVLLAGVGVSLLHARTPGRGLVPTLLWRAGLLLVMGLSLQLLDHGASVILATYAVLFLLAPFLVRLPDRALLVGAGVCWLVGPVVLVLTDHLRPHGVVQPELGDGLATVLAALLVTGRYPLVVWVVPFLVGLWLGRRPLGEARFVRRLGVVGVAASVTGLVGGWLLSPLAAAAMPWDLGRLASGEGHSGMPLWLLESLGLGCVVLACALAAGLTGAGRRGSWLWPVSAAGRLALTYYIAHLVLLALVLRPLQWPPDPWSGIATLAVLTVLALAFAPVWLRTFRHGPAEFLLRPPTFTRSSGSRARRSS